MELNFIYNEEDKEYTAEVTALSDINVHIELSKAAPVCLYQKTVEDGEYMFVGHIGRYEQNVDCDIPNRVYPKFYKIMSSEKVLRASVTSGYATNDLEELKAEVARQKTINDAQQEEIDRQREYDAALDASIQANSEADSDHIEKSEKRISHLETEQQSDEWAEI